MSRYWLLFHYCWIRFSGRRLLRTFFRKHRKTHEFDTSKWLTLSWDDWHNIGALGCSSECSSRRASPSKLSSQLTFSIHRLWKRIFMLILNEVNRSIGWKILAASFSTDHLVTGRLSAYSINSERSLKFLSIYVPVNPEYLHKLFFLRFSSFCTWWFFFALISCAFHFVWIGFSFLRPALFVREMTES